VEEGTYFTQDEVMTLEEVSFSFLRNQSVTLEISSVMMHFFLPINWQLAKNLKQEKYLACFSFKNLYSTTKQVVGYTCFFGKHLTTNQCYFSQVWKNI
jgi:hypothetical protein